MARQQQGAIAQLADERGETDLPSTVASAVPEGERPKGLRYRLSQHDVLQLFGNPHGKERLLDSAYWYDADGAFKGQDVRFNATTDSVNGWSTIASQPMRLKFRTSSSSVER